MHIVLVATQMLLQRAGRFMATVVGLGALFFLSSAQVGMLVGWCHTVSAIIIHADVDLWIMSPLTSAFDYGAPIPSYRIGQVRTVEGVSWAEGMYMDWGAWQRPDGKRITIEMVGLDDSSVGGPWLMQEGTVDSVHLPDAVIVDVAFLGALGVEKVGDEVELYGRRAKICGISRAVRTFTASPFVFTSLRQARRFDVRYRDDEITYVLARCTPGADPAAVKQMVLDAVPQIEVLTTREFAARTISYWMLGTGIGITVVLTAVLGLSVSAVVVSQTLYAITQDNLRNYATLLAIGFPRWTLVVVILFQSSILGLFGFCVGTLIYFQAADLSVGTPVPLEMIPVVYAGLAIAHFASCITASFLSVKSVFHVDPAAVFRA